MVSFGELWLVVASCGELWRIVASCGELWRVVANCGELWRVVVSCGELWRVVASCGKFELVISNCFWDYPKTQKINQINKRIDSFQSSMLLKYFLHPYHNQLTVLTLRHSPRSRPMW